MNQEATSLEILTLEIIVKAPPPPGVGVGLR